LRALSCQIKIGDRTFFEGQGICFAEVGRDWRDRIWGMQDYSDAHKYLIPEFILYN
jgi:hypothetical protein